MLELKKEIKQNPAALALLGISGEQEGKEDKAETIKKPSRAKTSEAKKRNPRGYQRNRGKYGTKPMSYYIPQNIIDLLNVKAAKEGVSKSSLVVEGLKYILRDELKELRNKEKEKDEAESEKKSVAC